MFGIDEEKCFWEDYGTSNMTFNVSIVPHIDYFFLPEKIIYNGDTTVCIFPDGERVTSRPMEGDRFDKEVGVAMCIVKRMYGSRSEFQRRVEAGYVQNQKER